MIQYSSVAKAVEYVCITTLKKSLLLSAPQERTKLQTFLIIFQQDSDYRKHKTFLLELFPRLKFTLLQYKHFLKNYRLYHNKPIFRVNIMSVLYKKLTYRQNLLWVAFQNTTHKLEIFVFEKQAPLPLLQNTLTLLQTLNYRGNLV